MIQYLIVNVLRIIPVQYVLIQIYLGRIFPGHLDCEISMKHLLRDCVYLHSFVEAD